MTYRDNASPPPDPQPPRFSLLRPIGIGLWWALRPREDEVLTIPISVSALLVAGFLAIPWLEHPEARAHVVPYLLAVGLLPLARAATQTAMHLDAERSRAWWQRFLTGETREL